MTRMTKMRYRLPGIYKRQGVARARSKLEEGGFPGFTFLGGLVLEAYARFSHRRSFVETLQYPVT